MTEIIFDIETNGLLRKRPNEDTALMDRVWCVAEWVEGEDEPFLSGPDAPIGDTVAEILRRWMGWEVTLIGHNILTFDIPALQSVYPWFKPTGPVFDTKILATLAWPDVRAMDIKARMVEKGMPSHLVGTHKLAAWGYRLGALKGTYADTTDWSEYTPEMGEYCRQDVRVTKALWDKLKTKGLSDQAVQIEHDFAAIIDRQTVHGWKFNKQKAEELQGKLEIRKAELNDELGGLFPSRVLEPNEPKDPETPWWSPTPLKTTAKEIPFNPASQIQVAYNLVKKYGWKPLDFTPTGQPKVDENVLKGLPYPEAEALLEVQVLKKVLGYISNGKNAWLNCVGEDGRVHGEVNTNGAVSGRCSHYAPNVAQVPSGRKPYGKECRELFETSPGWKIVGCDASGLELRCLAHYLAEFDGGAYAEVVCDGDIHTKNQEAAGLETRDQSKQFFYSLIFGAGEERLGAAVGGGKTEGRRMKKRFIEGTLGFKELQKKVRDQAKKHGHLIGLDGRILPCRSEHSALNLLLQSAGAVLMKQANIDLWALLGIDRTDVYQVGMIHDELQLEALAAVADDVGQTAVRAIQGAGGPFGFKCRLDAEYRVGDNWSETH